MFIAIEPFQGRRVDRKPSSTQVWIKARTTVMLQKVPGFIEFHLLR